MLFGVFRKRVSFVFCTLFYKTSLTANFEEKKYRRENCSVYLNSA